MDRVQQAFFEAVKKCGDENMSPEEKRAAMAYFRWGWNEHAKEQAVQDGATPEGSSASIPGDEEISKFNGGLGW